MKSTIVAHDLDWGRVPELGCKGARLAQPRPRIGWLARDIHNCLQRLGPEEIRARSMGIERSQVLAPVIPERRVGAPMLTPFSATNHKAYCHSGHGSTIAHGRRSSDLGEIKAPRLCGSATGTASERVFYRALGSIFVQPIVGLRRERTFKLGLLESQSAAGVRNACCSYKPTKLPCECRLPYGQSPSAGIFLRRFILPRRFILILWQPHARAYAILTCGRSGVMGYLALAGAFVRPRPRHRGPLL